MLFQSNHKGFGDARIILVERKPEVLQAFRQGLRERGLFNVIATDSLGELEDKSAQDLIDLIVCGVDDDHEGFPALNQLIRQGGHGPNPYVVTVGVTASPTESNIKRVMEAGIDSILLKPLSMNALLDRISALVLSRKSFVVSTDYIGPDRRMRPRQEVSLPLIDVPNTLKSRFDETYNDILIREEIAKANRRVNIQRATQDAVLINEIVRQIAPGFDSGQVDDSVLVHLYHLQRTVRDISRRMDKEKDAAVSKLCKALFPIVEKLIANHLTPDLKDVRLLQDVATAVFMAYGTEERVEKLSDDIAATISSAERYADPNSS